MFVLLLAHLSAQEFRYKVELDGFANENRLDSVNDGLLFCMWFINEGGLHRQDADPMPTTLKQCYLEKLGTNLGNEVDSCTEH